jgi:AcrR family transcriptional regulator
MMSVPNHEARRRSVSRVIFDVIAREGLEAATIRRIASEVGFSTAVVTHYFADKNEMLLSAYDLRMETMNEKFEKYSSSDPPDLIGYLLSLSALDSDGHFYWRAHVAIWDKCLRDERFLEKARHRIEVCVGQIEHFLSMMDADIVDKTRQAHRLFALMQGISTHILMDDRIWSRDTFIKTLSEEIEGIAKG